MGMPRKGHYSNNSPLTLDFDHQRLFRHAYFYGEAEYTVFTARIINFMAQNNISPR